MRGPVQEICDYLPFAETLILICFRFDSSRLARCSVKTPLRYSARMFSGLTVLGREAPIERTVCAFHS